MVRNGTVCRRSFDPFCVVIFYMNWIKTSWTLFKINQNIKSVISIEKKPKTSKHPRLSEYCVDGVKAR